MTWEVRQGDALDVLRSLAARSVSAIVTDPPYCSGGRTEAAKKGAKEQLHRRDRDLDWFTADAMTTPGLVWLLRSMAFEAERLLVPGGSMFVFTDWRMWSNLAPALESGGLRLQNMIVWDKGNAGCGVGFRATHELIAHLCAGTGSFHSATFGNVLRVPRVPTGDKEHATQKPVELLTPLVRVAAPRGGLVVDPFCGSGSTGVACVREGRRFLGIERDPGHCETARKRLSAEGEQRDLFAPTTTEAA